MAWESNTESCAELLQKGEAPGCAFDAKHGTLDEVLAELSATFVSWCWDVGSQHPVGCSSGKRYSSGKRNPCWLFRRTIQHLPEPWLLMMAVKKAGETSERLTMSPLLRAGVPPCHGKTGKEGKSCFYPHNKFYVTRVWKTAQYILPDNQSGMRLFVTLRKMLSI